MLKNTETSGTSPVRRLFMLFIGSDRKVRFYNELRFSRKSYSRIREYIGNALKKAKYETLDDGTFSGEIPECPGTIAFGNTMKECCRELESALEDWLLSALRHGDK